jgi:hypothetical protein
MSGNQAHAPLLVKSFPKTPRTQSEASWFGVSHIFKTKQNKLPSFIDRLLFTCCSIAIDGSILSLSNKKYNSIKTLCTSTLIVYLQTYDTLLPTSYFPILTLVIVNICGKDVINVFLFSICEVDGLVIIHKRISQILL